MKNLILNPYIKSSMGVMDYVKARMNAFTQTINAATQEVQSEGPVKATVDIVESGFGTLNVNHFGQAASKNRAQARKELMNMAGGLIGRR